MNAPHNHDINHDARAASPLRQAAFQANHQDDTRLTQKRIRLRIPKSYHHDPIISQLISTYGLTVNIKAALLAVNAKEDGWFDLELRGKAQQIGEALTYMTDLDLEIWDGADVADEGW